VEESLAALLHDSSLCHVSCVNGVIRPLAEEYMATQTANFHEHLNPLDRVERLAESRRWPMDRTSDDEVVMIVSGGWCNLQLSLYWRDDLEALQFACSYDLKVPELRQTEVARLLSLINAQLLHGHFDFWLNEGTVNFRHSLILAGGAEANDAQCDALIRAGVDSCQRYFPALQFVIWAGQSAEAALDNALLETQGEA
jgi:hypothetical protein